MDVGPGFKEIRLEAQSMALDEMHIIGYGSESKRFSVGFYSYFKCIRKLKSNR